MTLRVLVHQDPDGSLWAEVPALPGCYTTGESLDQIEANAREAILAYLDEPTEVEPDVRVLEIAV
jgi:predicted RNase H-like HicB family nuclease